MKCRVPRQLVAGIALATWLQPVFPASAAETPRRLLAQAEALYAGFEGHFDPVTAFALFEQAAVTADPVASYRLALVLQGRDSKQGSQPTDAARATMLYERSAPKVEALAAAGDAYAQYLVGTGLLLGFGGKEDDVAARRWLEKATAENVAWAWHNLAWMREKGKGFEGPEPGTAIALYRRACEAGNVYSMLDFSRLTLTPEASGPLCEEGLRWLERSARSGFPKAAAQLGKLLYYGVGACVLPAPARALEWLESGSRADERGASYDLGLALVMGDAGRPDPARAVALLERAAGVERDPIAVETLAWLNATGIGVPRDAGKARSLVAEAARLGSDGFQLLARGAFSSRVFQRLLEAGIERLEALTARSDPAAASLLALVFYNGTGVQTDYGRAVALARSAAAAGEPAAMRTLAHAYRHGNGVAESATEAVRWWRRCAEAGDSFCMMFYGQSLLEGALIERDLAAGLAWLTRAGEAGNWWAIGDLGHLYDEGWYGLPRDEAKATHWKQLVARLGDAEARGWLVYHGYPVE